MYVLLFRYQNAGRYRRIKVIGPYRGYSPLIAVTFEETFSASFSNLPHLVGLLGWGTGPSEGLHNKPFSNAGDTFLEIVAFGESALDELNNCVGLMVIRKRGRGKSK